MNYVGHLTPMKNGRKRSRVKNMRKCFEKSLKIRKYNNLVDALRVSRYVRRMSGILVADLNYVEGQIISKFSWFGFVFFLLWYSLYFYCSYIAYIEDQTILRHLYDTKVQLYGDNCERINSVLYVFVAMWSISFGLSGNTRILQIFIDVDKALENLGEIIDFNKDAYAASFLSFGQLVVYAFRLLTAWTSLKLMNVDIPIERMYQVTLSDTLAIISAAYYCYFLRILKIRLQHVKKVLIDINTNKSWEYKLFVRGKMVSNVEKAGNLQDQYISQKIRSCAKIYGMLFKVILIINDVFGLILVMTMFFCLVYIILYLFYFMEATSEGLFQDVPQYIHFTVYVFTQTGFSIGILYFIVYFCESVIREARETTCILHQIMSSDLSPLVVNEAMQLSLQLLHQQPVFSAYGLYQLNYALFEQGARSVSTYLVILLQFVADSNI